MAADLVKASNKVKLTFPYRIWPSEEEKSIGGVNPINKVYEKVYDLNGPGLGAYYLDFSIYDSIVGRDYPTFVLNELDEILPQLTPIDSPAAIRKANELYDEFRQRAEQRLKAKYEKLGGKFSRYQIRPDDIDIRVLTIVDELSEESLAAERQLLSDYFNVLNYNIKDACELEDYNTAQSEKYDKDTAFAATLRPGFTYAKNNACFVPSPDVREDPTEEVFIQEFQYIQETLQNNNTLFVVLQRKGLRNVFTLEVTPIEPPKFEEIKRIEIPAVTVEPEDPRFYVYKKFKQSEIIKDDFISKTYGVWGSNGELMEFYTSSTQPEFDKQYMLHVVSSSCDVNNMFTIHYGDINGYGTVNVSGSRNRRSYSKMIYSKYKNLCLEDNKQFILNDGFSWPSTPNQDNLDFDGDLFQVDNTFYSKDNKFTQKFPTRKVNRIFALKVPRELYGDKLDEGNVELNFSRLNPSTISPLDEQFTFSLIDASLNRNNATSSGFVEGSSYDLISGSILRGRYNGNIEVAYTSYGKFYPNMGLFILDADKLNSVLNLGLESGSNTAGNNPYRIFASISGSALTGSIRKNDLGFKLRKVDNQITSYYHVNVTPKDFNYSNNPTYVTDELFVANFATTAVVGYPIKNKEFVTDPTSYITTIGLYNDKYELLAVGKLSKAIKKTHVDSKTFIVRLNTTNV